LTGEANVKPKPLQAEKVRRSLMMQKGFQKQLFWYFPFSGIEFFQVLKTQNTGSTQSKL